MKDENKELLKELALQQAVSSEVSVQLRYVGTAYIWFFVTIFIFGTVGLHRLYLGRGNIIIGIFYFPLTLITLFILPLYDLIMLSSVVDKANNNLRDKIDRTIRQRYMPTTQETQVGTITDIKTGGSKTTALAICAVILLIGVVGYKFGHKATSTTKKSVTVSQEPKFKRIPHSFPAKWKASRNKLSVTTAGVYELTSFGEENIKVKTIVTRSKIGFLFIDDRNKHIKAKTSLYHLKVTRTDGKATRYTISPTVDDKVHWVNNSSRLIMDLKKALGKDVKVTMNRPDGRAYYYFTIPVRGFTKTYNGFKR